MSKIAIFCHGVPNLDSNQPNADTLMHAKKLSTSGHEVKIISIYNEIYQSDETQEYYKNFKKISNRVILKLYPNLIDKELIKQRDKILNEFKPDLVINFFERAIELNRSIKIKKINFLSIPLDLIEILRFKLNLKMLLTFSFLNSLIFIISYKLRFKYLVNDAKINFISCPQSYDVFKKRKINNLRFFFPLNRIKPKNLPKNKQLLMIGNLNLLL